MNIESRLGIHLFNDGFIFIFISNFRIIKEATFYIFFSIKINIIYYRPRKNLSPQSKMKLMTKNVKLNHF